MPITIENKECAVVIGGGDIGMTGVVSPSDGLVGVVVNQFKDKIEISKEPLTTQEVSERYDEDAATLTLLFTNKTALENMINTLIEIKEHCK
jgi:hypothetical protein